jgi:hypothetical protein
MGRRQLCNQFGSRGAVVDVASGDFESHRQTLRIDSQMDLARMPGAASADRFRLTAGSTGTVLMGFHIGTIDERSHEVRLLEQSVENVVPLAGRRPGVEALIDRVPAPEGAGQISPGAAHAHPVEHSLNRHSQIWLMGKSLAEAEFFPASTKARY